jgi:aspartate kinase
MSLIVQKFGGTSLENICKIKAAAKKVSDTIFKGNKVAVVVSAMAGTTNKLVSYCSEISNLSNQESLSEYDAALCSGEIITASLFALALQSYGVQARSCQAWQIKINTTDSHAKALITSIDTDYLHQLLDHNIVPVVTGFQGISQDSRITTLGRGGSDTTAAAIAAAMSADICEIYTDVDGVYSADPRMVHNAKKINSLTYEEMLTFAICGAKVLHARSVQIAMRFGLTLKVLSSFQEGIGTIITNKEKIMEKSIITGIAYNNNVALVKIQGNKINLLQPLCAVGLGIENLSYSPEFMSFTIPLIELARMKEFLEESHYDIQKNIAVISVVSHSMTQEIMAQIIKIADNTEIYGMITSEVKMSMIVKIEDLEHLVNRLHQLIISPV